MFFVAKDRLRVAAAPWVLLAGASLSGCAGWMPMTPDLSMTPSPGSEDVDPRKPVIVQARGAGARLLEVDVRDASGRTLDGRLEPMRYTLTAPLAFGTRYRVRVRGENAFGLHRISQEMQFTTVPVPRLEGGNRRVLGKDGAVTLVFDRPIGIVRPRGDATVERPLDQPARSLRVIVPPRSGDGVHPLTLDWESAGGIPLPPLTLELEWSKAEPLNVKLDVAGQSQVGILLPLSLTFSETPAERELTGQRLQVLTADGEPIAGRWHWMTDRRLRFTPSPHWPPSTTIRVEAEPGSIRTAKGGTIGSTTLGSFTTGADRRIAVYLDAQRVVALEDGKVVRLFKASTGKAATPTVTGSFYIYARYPLKTMKSDAKPGEPGHYVVENVPYAQYFHKDYALHGAWWHNGFGRPASHGCINLATRTRNRRWPNSPEDAGWLYQWASLGVPVTVYAKTPANEPAIRVTAGSGADHHRATKGAAAQADTNAESSE